MLKRTDLHPRRRAYNLKTGDYITNVGDINPTWIGLILSTSRRSYQQNIFVKLIKRPTRLGQLNMPDEFEYPYEMAINVFRKLTEAEQLLYTQD